MMPSQPHASSHSDRCRVNNRAAARGPHLRGFTFIEVVISVAIVAMVLALLLPALRSARATSQRDQCAANQRIIGAAWTAYLAEHNNRFPAITVPQPGWVWGGVRFSVADDSARLDSNRPVNAYVGGDGEAFHCPADDGIAGATPGAGTGGRSAFRALGTSYRANSAFFNASQAGVEPPDAPQRGLVRNEINVSASRLLMLGDAGWYETAVQTGGAADWHREPDTYNLLFLDGSVRFLPVKPRSDHNQAILFEPVNRETIVPAAMHSQ